MLGEVSIDQNEQQDFFDENVSLIVSNVRMFGSNCRRPFLSYYCQLMFGGFFCSSSSPEEQYCLEDQFCIQVSDSCSDDFSLNCSSSLSSPSLSSPSPSPLLLSCEEKVTKEIEEVVETPIKVQTCLDNSKEEIECCIGPYVFDDNDECVVQCPQSIYGDNWEKGLRITAFVSISFTIVIYVVLLTPFYMTDNLRFFFFFIFRGEKEKRETRNCLKEKIERKIELRFKIKNKTGIQIMFFLFYMGSSLSSVHFLCGWYLLVNFETALFFSF